MNGLIVYIPSIPSISNFLTIRHSCPISEHASADSGVAIEILFMGFHGDSLPKTTVLVYPLLEVHSRAVTMSVLFAHVPHCSPNGAAAVFSLDLFNLQVQFQLSIVSAHISHYFTTVIGAPSPKLCCGGVVQHGYSHQRNFWPPK